MTTTSNVVVLGAGHWHVPLYRDAIARRHRVLGVQDAFPDSVAGLAAAWDAPVVATVAEALDRDDIELAYVFGPHDAMAATCYELIARRIPFVVEKPVGISLAELQAVAAAARHLGVPVAVPLVQRGGPVDAWLRQAGRPVYERMSFLAGPPQRYRDNGSPWMLDRDRAGGGCLANLGPHFVDLFIDRVGTDEFDVVSSLRSTLHGEGVEDHATLLLSTSDGRESIVEVGYVFPGSPLKRDCSFAVAGELGFASIDTDGAARFTDLEGRTVTATLDVDSDPLYSPFVDRVADTLASGFAGLPGLGDLASAMRVIWHAYERTAAHG